MSVSGKKQVNEFQIASIFRALPKADQLAAAHYILADGEVQESLEPHEIPNETTLESFAEKKSDMPAFNSIEDLRKDLLS